MTPPVRSNPTSASAAPTGRSGLFAARRAMRDPRSRPGTILILFVILVPILFGLGALVLDLGSATYTRTAMQTAADAGAMEGLRARDDADLLTVDAKRASVASVVSQIYDDDGDTASDAMDLGAGKTAPFFAADPGTSKLNERRTIDGASIASYKPALQPNVTDLREGDMLGGTYDATKRHDEGYAVGNPYDREDFVSSFGGTDYTAFLVRLRRTIRPEGTNSVLDQQFDVSSSGATIPILFGRLSAIQGGDPGSGFSVRHSGLAIRATAITQGVPAMSVGPTIPALAYGTAPLTTIVGLAPFALDLAYWNSLTAGVASTGVRWVIPPSGTSGDLIQGVTVVGKTIGVWRSTASIIAVDPTVSLESNTNVPAFTNPRNGAAWRLRLGREVVTVTSLVPATTYDYNITRGTDGTSAAAHPDNIGAYLMDFLNVGDSLVPVDRPGADDADGSATRQEVVLNLPPVVYVPLYADVGGGLGERIVGFGAAAINFDGVPALNDLLSITKQTSIVAPKNASATPRHPITGFPDYNLDPVPWDALFTTGRNTIDQPLLAPASVRSYSK